MDWACITNGEERDPMHCPRLGTRGQEKKGETEGDTEVHSGERTAGAGFKI